MSYTPPSGNAANATWVGAPAYTAPAGNAATVTWQVTVSDVTGQGAATLSLAAIGLAAHGVSGLGAASIAVTPAGQGEHTALVVEGAVGSAAGAMPFVAAGQGAHGVAGSAAIAINCTGSGRAAHGVGGSASSAITCRASGASVHARYELRGEVREGGVLVNRRVRAYLRSSGALMGEVDTVVGKFRLHTGFAIAEHYITPIDLSDTAADWLPPTANRILPVLAQDTP